MSVTGGVQYQTLIAIAAFDFPLDETHRVFRDPADGSVLQAGKFGVAFRPSHDILGGIDVHDFRPGAGCRERCAPRVCEQIQDSHR